MLIMFLVLFLFLKEKSNHVAGLAEFGSSPAIHFENLLRIPLGNVLSAWSSDLTFFFENEIGKGLSICFQVTSHWMTCNIF